MEGLMTDIIPPSLANFRPFAANGSKVFTMIDPSPVMPSGGNYTFTVDKWDGGNTIYSPTSPSFTHDFRQAKSYALSITDPFGNSTSQNVQVVANIPTDIITSPIAGFTAGGTASSYTGTFVNSVVADVNAVHSINVHLRDKYGNPVKNEPGIKTINVRVAFNNNVDKDQRDIIL
jgi:hypothetical protein